MVLALALPLLLGTACSSGGDSAEPAASTVPTAEVPTTIAADDGQPMVVLEDPGSEPRRVLLLRVAPGAQVRLTMESRIGIDLTINGEEAPPTESPNSTMILDQRVERVDPDGTVHFSVTVADVSVDATSGADPELASDLEDRLSELVGLTGNGSIDAHGGAQTMEFDTSGLTDPQMAASLESVSSQVGNLSAPFPREPVGAGAKWTATSSATVSGILMNTTTRYTLLRQSGDRYELEYTQDAEAPPGPASLPGMPAGTQATITSFMMQSSGETVGDLTRHVPTSNEFTGEGDATMNLVSDGERVTLEQHLTIGYSLTAT